MMEAAVEDYREIKRQTFTEVKVKSSVQHDSKAAQKRFHWYNYHTVRNVRAGSTQSSNHEQAEMHIKGKIEMFTISQNITLSIIYYFTYFSKRIIPVTTHSR